MRRERATTLLTEMLSRLVEGGWPLELVDEVYVFGSYARGAPDPHDVDVAVEHRADERWKEQALAAVVYGGDWNAPLRRALAGRSRGIELAFNQREAYKDIPMTLVWRRGDALEQALGRLVAIRADADAGRAERDAMLPAFEGLDRWLIRPMRVRLVNLASAGAITIAQFEFPDAGIADLQDAEAQEAIVRRWNEDSPLRRAAIAALVHLEVRGISPRLVHLQGHDIEPPRYVRDGHLARVVRAETLYFVSFNCRYLRAMPRCLTEWPGGEWIEVPHPTRRQPLLALRISALNSDVLAAEARRPVGF